MAATAIVAGAMLVSAQSSSRDASSGSWRQWGGPNRSFVVEASGLAESWPDEGPPRLWSRPLGLGHSAIVVDGGILYTMYRPGRQVSRRGPWEARETVIAMDAASGRTVWEHTYPSEPANFSFGAGPHATPLIVGERLFTAGTNKQIHALDRQTGRVIWMRDLVKDFDAPPLLVRPAVKAGYGVSPLAWKDTIILQAGGKGQAVMALRQQDGSVAWKSGDFLVAEAAPLLIELDGQPQVVIFGGQSVNGLDPDTGRILWSHPHDTSGDMNNSTPTWGAGNLLIVSSAYNQGTRALRLTRDDTGTRVEEAWFTNRMKLIFGNGIRLGDYLYGTHGDFGPAFLTALDVNTGTIVWQERGFGKSTLLYAGGKAIILDEDGTLALATLSPEGATILSRAHIFDGTSWTVPTLVGTTLYARDREKIVALDLGAR